MRALVFLHRWLGVALCLLFIVWFPSGIGMMYWDFPAITPADRLARSPALDGSTVALSPSQAFAVLGLAQVPAQVRIDTFDGRPVYRFGAGRSERTVYADTGDEREEASPDLMLRAAARWSGRREQEAAIEPVVEPDQWTVQGPLRTLRPLWKYSWPDGQQVYVAQSTGEVVQYTTSASRLGAYLGPIPHWLYFTPLRSRQTAWSRVVIWSSGIGTIGAILGLAIGIARYSPSRRYRYADVPTSIPYRGQKRWHMALGLIFGLGAATWAVSGMLSMDPFPALNGDGEGRRADTAVAAALRGPIDLAAFDRKPPRAALAQLIAARRRWCRSTASRARTSIASGSRSSSPMPPRRTAPRSACSIATTRTISIGTARFRCRSWSPRCATPIAPAITSTRRPRASPDRTAHARGRRDGCTTLCTRSTSRGCTPIAPPGTSSSLRSCWAAPRSA
jgi:hypothetical protein